MSGVEPPWEELHHRSYFLPPLDRLEHEDYREILSQRVGSPMIPLSSPGQMADGNMVNISSTISINISRNPGTIENVYIGADCSQAEILEYTELFKDNFPTPFIDHILDECAGSKVFSFMDGFFGYN